MNKNKKLMPELRFPEFKDDGEWEEKSFQQLFETGNGIGIILCAEKDETIVKYSVLKENKQLFASKYKTVLPTEEELAAMIAVRNRKLIEEINNNG